MGQIYSLTYRRGALPPEIPESGSEPTFPPDFGFEAPRKERVMKISQEEMRALQLHPDARNYCAHLAPAYLDCRRRKAPFYVLCKPELHEYHHCALEDYILRLKEFEREKRLRIREQKQRG